MTDKVIAWLLMLLPPLLMIVRLVFIAKFMRGARSGIVTGCIYFVFFISILLVLFWFDQVHTTLYGPHGARGWGLLIAMPALVISALFLELATMIYKIKSKKKG